MNDTEILDALTAAVEADPQGLDDAGTVALVINFLALRGVKQ